VRTIQKNKTQNNMMILILKNPFKRLQYKISFNFIVPWPTYQDFCIKPLDIQGSFYAKIVKICHILG